MKLNSLIASSSMAAGLGLAVSLSSAQAQIPWATDFFPRQGKMDIYGVGQYLHQDNTTFPGPLGGTPTLKLDDTGLGGVGFGYHFTDFIAFHTDFMLGPANLRAENPGGGSTGFGQNAFLQSGRFNVDYNIINRRLTPFLTAGIGYQYLQVEQENPDYYYYHHNYYSQADFTWNVGAGVRWNITDNLFVKLTGGAQWLEYEDSNSIATQIEAFLSIGCTLP